MLDSIKNIFTKGNDDHTPINTNGKPDIKREHSSELFEKAKKYFPGGVNSPVRAFKAVHGNPLFIEKGDGCHLYDVDGNKFIDFCCSWGPLILGHNNPKIRERVSNALANGLTFGAPNATENDLAELILKHHKYLEKIRFVNSGTEAVMSALRLARGFTGRNKVVKFEGCYHGAVDSMLVKAGSGLVTFGQSSSAGVPESYVKETLVLPLNDLEALKAVFKKFGQEIAAIIIEPVPANNGLLIQEKSFLQELRTIATQHGALLIFDEVISGFRLGFEGAAGYFQITPDLITFGKIIGGGLPVGCYGGRADIMSRISPEGDVYQAGTLSGNPIAMAAGVAQLNELLKRNFYQDLNRKSEEFAESIQRFATARNYKLKVFSLGSLFWFAFTEKEHIRRADEIVPDSMEKFKQLHNELLNRGVYLSPSGYEVGFISASHSKVDLEVAKRAVFDSLDVIFKRVNP